MARFSVFVLPLVAALVAGSVGCRRSSDAEHRERAASASATTAKSAEPPPLPPIVRLERETRIRESSGVVLARLGDKLRAFVADEDDSAIVEMDLDTKTVARATPIRARPRDLLLLGDGTIAVTLPDENAVAVFARDASGALREIRRQTTPNDPQAMGLSPDDQQLYVSTGNAHALVALDAASLAQRARWDLPREPRAVLVSDDGKNVFVSHAAESEVSVVPTEGAAAIARVDIGIGQHCITTMSPDEAPCTSKRSARHAHALARFGNAVVVPAAQALPNPPASSFPRKPQSPKFEALGFDGNAVGSNAPPLVAEERPRGFSGYGLGDDSSGPPVFSNVSAIDPHELKKVATTGQARSGSTCLLPRAAAASKDALFIACMGSSRVEKVWSKQGITGGEPMLTGFRVSAGPTALAVDRTGDKLFVWSSFGRALTIVSDASQTVFPQKVARREKVPAPDAPMTITVDRAVARDESWLRGRALFFTNGDPRISADGRACASCHVDGKDDGITWDTPNGKRRTRTLAGQLTGAPYGWKGEHPSLEAHVKITFRQLQGTGLAGDDLTALLAYLQSLPKPRPRVDPSTERGKQLFADADCSSCHLEGGTDRSVHDVGTGGSFLTPTLAGIATRRQMMHDGRYASLDELVAKSRSMGRGSDLSPEERTALVRYLETL